MLGMFLADSSLASDGMIEINAVKAAVGGVTPGDGAGFPVTLSVAGSYRLTSNLDPLDPDTTGIEITVPNVTLDLGGFAIANSCGQLCGAGAGFGVRSTVYGSTVKNGRVSGAGADGVSLEGASQVEDIDASFNVGSGITVSQGSVRRVSATGNFGNGVTLSAGLLEDSEFTSNGGKGANLGVGVGYARNVFSGNATSVSGGHATGGNVCSDKLCSTSGARRFYLSKGSADGSAAATLCAAGFHVASVWEILDPNELFYDLALGRTSLGSGQGPPAEYGNTVANANVGWVQTGIDDATTPQSPGLINCHGYTTGSAQAYGTLLRMNGDPVASTPTKIAPWTANAAGCNEPWKAWCVED